MLLTAGASAAKDIRDEKLYQQMASLGGPLFGGSLGSRRSAESDSSERVRVPSPAATSWGLDPALFGLRPNQSLAGETPGAAGGTPAPLDQASLCVPAPSLIEIRLPADPVPGSEFVPTGVPGPQT